VDIASGEVEDRDPTPEEQGKARLNVAVKLGGCMPLERDEFALNRFGILESAVF
jgi:hypothetical protein